MGCASVAMDESVHWMCVKSLDLADVVVSNHDRLCVGTSLSLTTLESWSGTAAKAGAPLLDDIFVITNTLLQCAASEKPFESTVVIGRGLFSVGRTTASESLDMRCTSPETCVLKNT